MIGTVRDIARGGYGVVPGDIGPVFIPHVLAGEKIRYRVRSRRSSIQWGEAVEVLVPSPHRIAPACPHYGSCGGCNLQHADYSHQVEIKRSILKGNLQRIAAIPLPEECGITTSPPFEYRTRMVLQIRRGHVGFFRRGSHDVEPISRCPLMPEAMDGVFRELASSRNILDVDNGRLILLSNGSSTAAMLEQNRKKQHLYGPREILFPLPGFQFSVNPDNFIQANRFTLAKFQEWIDFPEGRWKGLDLYAGAGFLTLPLSRHCKSLTALEISPHNLSSLRRNLNLNKVSSVTIQRKRIGSCELQAADLMIADPPRSGLPHQVRTQLVRRPPRHLAYFSCDSATFSRDLSFLVKQGFSLSRIGIIDNTPQSDHMETVALLQWNKR